MAGRDFSRRSKRRSCLRRNRGYKKVSAQPIPGLTPEQYLEIERAAEFKSEYYCGAMYAMAGGTYLHGLIIGRMIILLGQRLDGGRCNVLTSDVRLGVSREGLFTY